jgi:hypothetical protein
MYLTTSHNIPAWFLRRSFTQRSREVKFDAIVKSAFACLYYIHVTLFCFPRAVVSRSLFLSVSVSVVSTVESIVARKERKGKEKTSLKKLHAIMISVGITLAVVYVLANGVTPYRQK